MIARLPRATARIADITIPGPARGGGGTVHARDIGHEATVAVGAGRASDRAALNEGPAARGFGPVAPDRGATVFAGEDIPGPVGADGRAPDVRFDNGAMIARRRVGLEPMRNIPTATGTASGSRSCSGPMRRAPGRRARSGGSARPVRMIGAHRRPEGVALPRSERCLRRRSGP